MLLTQSTKSITAKVTSPSFQNIHSVTVLVFSRGSFLIPLTSVTELVLWGETKEGKTNPVYVIKTHRSNRGISPFIVKLGTRRRTLVL